MKKSRALVSLAFILLIAGGIYMSPPESKFKIEQSFNLTSSFLLGDVNPAVTKIIQKQSKVSIGEKKEILEDAYLKLNLSEYDQVNVDSLNMLEAGLRSVDLEERAKSAHLVRNLIVKLADNQFQVSSEYQGQIYNLIKLFETNGKEEIKEISDANPESNTLAYIKSIKE